MRFRLVAHDDEAIPRLQARKEILFGALVG